MNRIPVVFVSGVLTLATALLAVPALLLAQTSAEKPASASVKGTALYRERIAMLPGATFEATLLDVSKIDAPAEVITTARIESPGNPPYSFSLEYDPARIDANHSYTVRATITRDGKPIFTSIESYPVITRGNPQEVNIVDGRSSALAMMPSPTARTILSQTLNSTRRSIASEAQAAAIA